MLLPLFRVFSVPDNGIADNDDADLSVCSEDGYEPTVARMLRLCRNVFVCDQCVCVCVCVVGVEDMVLVWLKR